MSVLIGKHTHVIVQGITGKQGTKISQEMVDYGTSVVAGVTPGKGGAMVDGVPVYDTVADALLVHPEANVSLVSVPPAAALDAAMEAMRCGRISLVNILTEGIPLQDVARICQAAEDQGVRVVGPSSIGIINPVERVKIGAIGGNDPGVFYPGEIAVFSKSGGMCLSISMEIFNTLGYGTSIVVGIGGDRIRGTTFRDLLELVRDDEQTQLVILNGEIGGTCEEEAAAYIRETGYPKPVIARLTGIGVEHIFPRGTRMGHAGAIIGERNVGTYESKVEAFERAGVPVAKTSEELIDLVERTMPRRGRDLEGPISTELELVKISKSKLENLKEQIRAVQIRTALTSLVEGVPYFRGYPLVDLIRNASVPEMAAMVFKREDVSREESRWLREDLFYCARRLRPGGLTLKAARAALAGGAPLQVAVSAALLAMQEPSVDALPDEIARRHTVGEARALMLAPQVINIVAALFESPLTWDEGQAIETAVFAAMSGRAPDAAEREITRAALVACTDHTPATPSSLAAVATYSGGNTMKTALAAGIAAMGETHAGAGEAAALALDEYLTAFRQARDRNGALERDGVHVEDIQALGAYMVDKVTGVHGGEKGRIPGFGHRYYGRYGADPRAEALLEIAGEHGLGGLHCELARAVEHALRERKSPMLCINIDGVIGALLCEMGLAPAAAKALFIMARTVGILGQLLEQRPGAFFRLSNDSIIYTGPDADGHRRFE